MKQNLQVANFNFRSHVALIKCQEVDYNDKNTRLVIDMFPVTHKYLVDLIHIIWHVCNYRFRELIRMSSTKVLLKSM